VSWFQGLVATWPGRLVALVIVGAIVGGGYAISNATATPAKTDYRTAPVTRGAVTQTVAVSGSINAAAQVRLNFKQGGRLSEVMVIVGQQVSAGQVLARIDATDLANAVTQAQASVASAQARYQQVVSGADANDLASAQQNLAKVQAGYASQKGIWQSASSGARSDASSVIGSLDPLQAILDRAYSELQPVAQPTPTITPRPTQAPPQATPTPVPTPNTSTADARTAQNAVSQAQLSLSNVRSSGIDQLWQAIGDYTTASLNIANAVAQFDSAIAGGGDTTSASLAFQNAQGAYTTASSRLSSVIDAVNSTVLSMQTSLTTAQNALNNPGSRFDFNLDNARADVASALGIVGSAQLNTQSAKTKLGQADKALSTVSDTVTGAYVSAINNIAKVTATPKPGDVASALASVTSAQASLDNANNNLANATLIAPVAGAIASINGQVGEQIGSPTSGFIVMAATGAIALHGTIGESDIAKIRLGQVANITVDALGAGTRMTGKVTSLDPVATIQQGVPVYGVDVTVDLPSTGVRPGMSGTAQVIIANKTGVLTVPNLAIKSQSGRRYVQVLLDGQPVDTDVQFGIANETVTEVTAGLKEGDLVVLPQPRSSPSGANIRVGPGGPPQQIGR